MRPMTPEAHLPIYDLANHTGMLDATPGEQIGMLHNILKAQFQVSHFLS